MHQQTIEQNGSHLFFGALVVRTDIHGAIHGTGRPARPFDSSRNPPDPRDIDSRLSLKKKHKNGNKDIFISVFQSKHIKTMSCVFAPIPSPKENQGPKDSQTITVLTTHNIPSFPQGHRHRFYAPIDQQPAQPLGYLLTFERETFLEQVSPQGKRELVGWLRHLLQSIQILDEQGIYFFDDHYQLSIQIRKRDRCPLITFGSSSSTISPTPPFEVALHRYLFDEGITTAPSTYDIMCVCSRWPSNASFAQVERLYRNKPFTIDQSVRCTWNRYALSAWMLSFPEVPEDWKPWLQQNMSLDPSQRLSWSETMRRFEDHF